MGTLARLLIFANCSPTHIQGKTAMEPVNQFARSLFRQSIRQELRQQPSQLSTKLLPSQLQPSNQIQTTTGVLQPRIVSDLKEPQ